MFHSINLNKYYNDYFNIEFLQQINMLVKDVPFELNIHNNMNNMICKNQIISINSNNVKRVYLIGFSEISYYYEEILFIYEHECLDKQQFYMKSLDRNYRADNSEWNYIDNAMCHDYYLIGQNEKMYIVYLDLQKNINLKEIEMPYNPNIHIFSLIYESL